MNTRSAWILCGVALIIHGCGQSEAPQTFVAGGANSAGANIVEPPPPAPPNYAPAIEYALQLDQQTDSHGLNMSRVAAMRAIDLSQTPGDFRSAYLEHVFAWERRLNAEQAWNNLTTESNNQTVLIGGVLCGILDCATNPINSRLEAEDRLQQEIRIGREQVTSTFQEVQRIAVRHGANPTPGAATGM